MHWAVTILLRIDWRLLMAKVRRKVLPVPRPMNADRIMGPQLIHGDHIRHIAPTAEQRNVMTRCRGHSRLFPVGIGLRGILFRL